MEERHVQPPSPQTLQIFTLGCFGLTVGGRGLAIEKWKRKQSLTLLKYLVIHVGRPVHRERLLDCLWPDIDESRGRGRLKVAMYYLRCQLRATGMDEDVVQTAGDTYKLRRETVWVDVEVFEKLFAEGCALQRQQQWGEALRCYQEVQPLYRGDYLEEETFADWCAEERERLREIYLELLAGMAECNAERGHYAEAVRVCRMALIREPCRESFHCALMEYFVRLGRPDWAVAQFRHCRRVLDREFGVEPMPETQHLHQQILKGEGGALAKENARGSRRARRPLRGAGAQPSA
jgi:two-component SAPR family response regulator